MNSLTENEKKILGDNVGALDIDDGHVSRDDAGQEAKAPKGEGVKKPTKVYTPWYEWDINNDTEYILGIKNNINKIMSEINRGIHPNDLMKIVEKIESNYDFCLRRGLEQQKLNDILKETQLKLDEKSSKPVDAYGLVLAIREMNNIRRDYMRRTSKMFKTEEDKGSIEELERNFERIKKYIEGICDGKKVPPLKTEQDYIKELKKLNKDTKRLKWLKKFKFFKWEDGRDKVVEKAKELYPQLKEVIRARKTDKIPKQYGMLMKQLKKEKLRELWELPVDLLYDEQLRRDKEQRLEEQLRRNKEQRLKVSTVKTPTPRTPGSVQANVEQMPSKNDKQNEEEPSL